jgi:ABC-type branched-subunit amino acid transport system ATPase component
MLLEVDGLRAFYGDLCALQNVCVHIDAGESVALVERMGQAKLLSCDA